MRVVEDRALATLVDTLVEEVVDSWDHHLAEDTALT